MSYVILAVLTIVALILIQLYRLRHSAKYYYPRSVKRMEEAERTLERLDQQATWGQLRQQDIVSVEKKMKQNAQWQRAQSVPAPELIEHRAQYARIYDLYALRLHDLAYNNGQGLALIDAYMEESARQMNQKADDALAELNQLMSELGRPTKSREEWMRELGG